MQFATKLLRHCVTRSLRFEGNWILSSLDSAPSDLASRGTKWHSVALNTKVELGSSAGLFCTIRPRCQAPIRFVFLIESQYIKQVMCFLPPDASQVRSCILGVPGTLAPADCRPARSLSASPGSPGVKLLGLQVSPLMCSRIGPRCFGIRAHSSYPKRSARPAKKLPESPPISLFFSRFLDQAPLDAAQGTA
jgi:hypothetical protein